jgi:hypothetical protein
MGGRRQPQGQHEGGDAFHGGLRQLARLLAAAIEEDQDLGRSTQHPTDPVNDLLDIEIRQRGARSTVSLSAVEADR